jgi:hypothetical protein
MGKNVPENSVSSDTTMPGLTTPPNTVITPMYTAPAPAVLSATHAMWPSATWAGETGPAVIAW